MFDFGKVDAEVAQTRGANAEALAAYKQVALKAAEDVENALMELAQARVRLEQLQGEVESLTRARDLLERAYKVEAVMLTDVLDADRPLLVARSKVESTRADAAGAAVHTFRALGDGWDGRSVFISPCDPVTGTTRKTAEMRGAYVANVSGRSVFVFWCENCPFRPATGYCAH
ncbi:MAG TPA: TolC family protein [Candidatus Acidoferrales bacterium]|nr:TolC family protein [Candidatus Acidoferrales bacterium]